MTAVSCAPLVRVTVNSASGAPFQTESSFLAMVNLLAFASLLTLIGVLMYSRHLQTTSTIESGGVSASAADRSPEMSHGRSIALNLSPLLIFIGMPMVHLLVPLWVFKATRQQNPVLAADAKHLLNFEITWTLFVIVGLLLSVVLVGLLILTALLIFHLVVTLQAAFSISKGRTPRFPLSLTFLK